MMDIVIGTAATVIALVLGMVFGAMPLQTERMSEDHKRWSQLLSIAGLGMVIILMIAKMDIASWTVIGAMIGGLAIVKIPPVHRRVLARFPWFAPASHGSSTIGRKRPR